MSERRLTPPSTSPFVLTAHAVLALSVAVVGLQWADVVAVTGGQWFTLLLWTTIAIGTTAALVRYRSTLGVVRAAERSMLGRWNRTRTARVLTAATRNLVLALAGLHAISVAWYPVGLHVDLGLLYAIAAASIALTLLVRTDRAATVAVRGGAFALVSLALLGAVFEPIRSFLGPTTYVLTGVFVGLAIWKGRDRLDTQVRERPLGRTEQTASHRTASRIALSALVLGAIAVYFYRLGALDLYGDEFQVVDVAAGYYHTGQLYKWDWIAAEATDVPYERAWPHTVLVAGSYAVFGISEWASRFPSALAGILTVPLGYYVLAYFTERRWVALVATAALVAYPSVAFFFRWTRMYALLIPLFLVLTYLVFRATTEGNSIEFGHDAVDDLVEKRFDFNLGLALLTLPLLYLGYHVHVGSLLVLPGAYLFVVYQSIATDEAKYRTASALGALGLLAVAAVVRFTDRLGFISYYVSAFERDNTVYVDYLFRFPIETALGVVFFVAGFVAIHLVRDATKRSKLVYLYLLCAFSLVFFVYVGDRYASFKYAVHVVPLALVLILYGFRSFVASFDARTIRYTLIGLLLLAVFVPIVPGAGGGEDLGSLYVEQEQDFSTAYATIESNYDPEQEAIFGQFLREYYLQDLDGEATVVVMQSDQRYSPEAFHRDVAAYGSGWITWETRKRGHVHPEIREYVDEHFEKHHGAGVDDTGVEVYYFDEGMVESVENEGAVDDAEAVRTTDDVRGDQTIAGVHDGG